MSYQPPGKTPRRPQSTKWPPDEVCQDCGGARWTAEDYGHPEMKPDGVRELHTPASCIRYLRDRLDDLMIDLGKSADI